MKLSYPEHNYEYRLTTLARGTVYHGCKADDVKQEIASRRVSEGDIIADDFAMICREIWRRLGL